MFYYPNVLQRHTGCFSTIWLAATKGIRITRREFLKVNIGRTCDDIIDYVKVQVPPLHPSLPRPQFSLYLSSQLQYGVVIVYHQQCAFLLEEAQQTIDRLLRSSRHLQIDMQDTDRSDSRLALNVPDLLFLLEEAEGAMEPFFGIMGANLELPSPDQLPQPWSFTEISSPDCPLVTRNKSTVATDLTVSPETITIKDKEQVTILTAEFGGEELPEATVHEIDLLIGMKDQFLLEEGPKKERDRTADSKRSRELEATVVSIEQFSLEPSLVLPGFTFIRLKNSGVEDRTWIMEDPGLPLESAIHKVVMEMTPPPCTITSTADASEKDLACSVNETPKAMVKIPEGKRGHRCQLIFADQHTQISQDAMRERIINTSVETLSLSNVLLQIPPIINSSLTDIFSSSCNLLIHLDLQGLWKQSCVPAVLPQRTIKRGHELKDSNMSDLENERDTEDKANEKRNRESSREVLRMSAEVGLVPSELSAASDVTLDASKGEKSQSDNITPTSRWSPGDEASAPMQMIMEERVELPQGESGAETGECTPHSLLRLLNSYMERFGKVLFYSLLPPEADRNTTAHLFCSVLELVCMKKLSVSQTEPYGPITISNKLLQTHG